MSGSSFEELKRIRVDHTGGLRAPKSLRDADTAVRAGTMSLADFEAERDAAIELLIQKQESVGLPVVNDGELRRANFQDSFNVAVEGLDPDLKSRISGQNASATPFVKTRRAGKTKFATSKKLTMNRNLLLEEYNFAAKLASRPVKVTLVGPDRIVDRYDAEGSKEVYRDTEEFLADVVAIERAMIQQLVDAGCKYIQIDAPGYTAYVDHDCIADIRSRGEDPDRVIERSIKADNDIIAGFDGVVFGLHICRGGARTLDPATGMVVPQWHREGHYDAIAERLFGGLNHQRLLLEYDSERAGGFEPLRYVSKDKVVVLGLVTTKSNNVESGDSLKRRVDEASQYIDIDRLSLSPQCGFGGIRNAGVPDEVQWRKFEVIVDAARSIWGSVE